MDDDDFWWNQRVADAEFAARQRGCLDCCEGTCEKPWPHDTERNIIGKGETVTQAAAQLKDIERLEGELDSIYHVGGLRDDFDNGVCRGLALALMVLRRSSVGHELKRSLNRLELREMHGEAPWQQTANT